MTLAKAEERLGTKSLLPQGWRWVRLGDICDMNPSRPAGFRRAFDALTTFVPMPAVDEHRGVIINTEIRPFSEVAKGYTFFSEGDILFAKITPCMQNGKQAIARGLIDGIGFGSTEFHVIRPRPGIASEWIHRFVRQPHVLSAAVNHFTGAVGQQRVPESFLASLEIPLSSIDEQDRIMHIVNEQMAAVEKARAAAEARLEAAKALPAAYMQAAFESLEARDWRWIKLGEVCKFINGDAYKESDWSTSGVPIIRIQNLNDRSKPFNYWQGPLSDRVKVSPGDLLLAWSGTPGTSFGAHIWDSEPAVLNQHIFRVDIDPDRGYPMFILHAINRQLDVLINRAHGGVGLRHVTRKEVDTLKIALPPLAEQKRIALILSNQFAGAERVVQKIQQEVETINALPAALLRQAFSGGM
jgi:type I restriction enzyme S subunit